MKTNPKASDNKSNHNKEIDDAQNSSGIQQNKSKMPRSKTVPVPPPLDEEHVSADKKSKQAFLKQNTAEIKRNEELEPEDSSQLYAPKKTEAVSEDFNDTKKGKDSNKAKPKQTDEETDNDDDYEQYKKDTPILNKDDTQNTNEIL